MLPFAKCSEHCTLWSQATFKARGTRHESSCVRWPLVQPWKADAIAAKPNYFRSFLKSSERTTVSNFEQLKKELDESVQGVNRYSPGNVELLEKCADFLPWTMAYSVLQISLMITGNHYDRDILLTTLKL